MDTESFYRQDPRRISGHAIQIIMHPRHRASASKEQLDVGGGGVQALSTQREQLWAVDKAAGMKGATLQALAASRRPTQREHL